MVGLGLCVAATIGIVVAQGDPSRVAASRTVPTTIVPLATVLREVDASDEIHAIPSDLVPPLSQVLADPEAYLTPESTGCQPNPVSPCYFGDRAGTHTMVLYGDSHAGMWSRALDDIAKRARWKLNLFVMASCPAALLETEAPGTHGDWVACDEWHRKAIALINQIAPDLLIVSQTAPYPTPEGGYYTPTESQKGLQRLFAELKVPRTVVLGNLPGSGGPNCLALHTNDVQACSGPPIPSLVSYDTAEKLMSTASGARYLDVTPWFCAKVCSSIIGGHEVYDVGNHVTEVYSLFLEGVLAQALGFPQQ